VKNDQTASVTQLTLSLNYSGDEPVIGNQNHSNFILAPSFMMQVLERNNLIRALKQVQRNKGAAGVDGMTTDSLSDYLKTHWEDIKKTLLEETYRPAAVMRVEIPKSDGSKRKLGIPTVLDRFIQQAIAQVLNVHWDKDFHENSYGFRPKRSAHQAIKYAKHIIQSGHSWVVDLDLKSFFDEVNHDRLMKRLAMRIEDDVVLRLINRYLKAGVQINGKKEKSRKGVPQGGPLSPILSNIVLDELDRELQGRGHKFARYADDCNIFVKSKASGERVKKSITHFIERTLRLKVNEHKSAVDRPYKRTFLGFTFSRRGNKIKVADKALLKLKGTVRQLTRRTRGLKLTQIIADLKKPLLGWKAYFDIAEVMSPLRNLDKWIRRKLRCYIWKQWGRAGYRNLRRLGIDVKLAWNTSKSAHGPWRLSGSPALYYALPNKYFVNLGLPLLVAR